MRQTSNRAKPVTTRAGADRFRLAAMIACALAGQAAAVVATASTGAGEQQSAAGASVRVAEQKGRPPAGWKPPLPVTPAPYSTQEIDPAVAKELREQWGVKLLGMRRSAAGMFLDFRFRVLDIEKSLPLFDHRIKPRLVAERDNITLPLAMSTKVGAFRPTNRGKNIKADKNYYMLFGNPDRHVEAGEKVSVIIGEFKVEHLIVN